VRDDLELVVLREVSGELRERAWEAYLDAFDELRATAIQRHVMSRDEFDTVMADERVQVYLARHLDGTIAAIATLANDLEAMRWCRPTSSGRDGRSTTRQVAAGTSVWWACGPVSKGAGHSS
jgi:hypothetical protein